MKSYFLFIFLFSNVLFATTNIEDRNTYIRSIIQTIKLGPAVVCGFTDNTIPAFNKIGNINSNLSDLAALLGRQLIVIGSQLEPGTSNGGSQMCLVVK